MRHALLHTAFLCGLLGAIACGSSESDDTPQSCTPGASVSCTGPGACSGFQVCRADGSGYDTCDCGGTGGTAGASGTAGAAGAPPSVCPVGLKGPALVEVKAPNGTRYCIDSTEVTFADFDEFIAANVDTSSEPQPCTNDTFDYNTYSTGSSPCMAGVTKKPDAPARCVAWCGAQIYCKWAGKRLCGRIGGGPANHYKPADPNESQWFNACSAGGTQTYAYGNTPIQSCNDSIGNMNNLSAKDPAECQGSVPGLFGMSSNAQEWEDACEVPGGCFARTRTAASQWVCDRTEYVTGNKSKYLGFRCCHDGVSQ